MRLIARHVSHRSAVYASRPARRSGADESVPDRAAGVVGQCLCGLSRHEQPPPRPARAGHARGDRRLEPRQASLAVEPAGILRLFPIRSVAQAGRRGHRPGARLGTCPRSPRRSRTASSRSSRCCCATASCARRRCCSAPRSAFPRTLRSSRRSRKCRSCTTCMVPSARSRSLPPSNFSPRKPTAWRRPLGFTNLPPSAPPLQFRAVAVALSRSGHTYLCAPGRAAVGEAHAG